MSGSKIEIVLKADQNRKTFDVLVVVTCTETHEVGQYAGVS